MLFILLILGRTTGVEWDHARLADLGAASHFSFLLPHFSPLIWMRRHETLLRLQQQN